MFSSVFQGKRVLITGHTGFKGTWLTRWLLHLGAQVTGFSIDLPTQPSFFDSLKLSSSITDLRGDICDLEAVKNAFELSTPQIVFHLAAQSLVRASYERPKETFDVNVGGTVNVLECLKSAGPCSAGVIVTSDKCYEINDGARPYGETDRLGGHDPYSASKAAAEIIFSAYARSFFQNHSCAIATVRAGNVIGGGDWAHERLVPDCVRSWMLNKNVVLRNPEAVRPWQHVLEPLYGYLLVAQKLIEKKQNVSGHSFNVGPDYKHDKSSSVSVATLVKELAKSWPGARWSTPKLARVTVGNDPIKHEAGFLSLNSEKARINLGWRPVFDLQTTCEFTIAWYKTFYETYANNSDALKPEDQVSGNGILRDYTLNQIKLFEQKLNAQPKQVKPEQPKTATISIND